MIALGKTGSGKSEVVAHAWAMSRRQRLLIDVNDKYEFGPAARAEGALEVERVRDIDWRVRTIRYVPRAGSQREYNDLYAAIWARGDLDVWLDECFGPTTQHRAPELLRRVVTQGRKERIRHMGTSQRPAMIMPELIDQAEHAFVFTLTNRDDLVTLSYRIGLDARTLGRELANLEQVPGHATATGYLRHTIGERVVRRMPPLPASAIAATRRHIVIPG